MGSADPTAFWDPEARWSSTVLRDAVTGRRHEFHYAEVDGYAIYQGDIVLGRVDALRTPGEVSAQGISISDIRYRWSGALVPYTIDPNLPDPGRVTGAIDHWQRNTRFRFILRTAENAIRYPNFVTFRPSTVCNSYVGKQGGQQIINLAPGCDVGSTIHEIGHAVGLWHEQSREDRNNFVRILWENITPGNEHNFDQHIADADDVGAYDYGSIMHYGAFAFSQNGQPTIEVLQPGATIGQRWVLSDGDISTVAFMYGNEFDVNLLAAATVLRGRDTELVAGDFNGDGRDDFLRREKGAAADDRLQTADLFTSNGEGTFGRGSPLLESYALRSDFTNAIVGDYNGDGRADFIRQEKNGWDNDESRNAELFTSNGVGGFSVQSITQASMLRARDVELTAGDFNGDKRTDFLRREKGARADDGVQTAEIYFSNGNGTFRVQALPEAHGLRSDFTNVIVGDYNGDGRADFIRQEKNGWDTDESRNAELFLSDGTGGFSILALAHASSLRGGETELVAADLDGDGFSDFIRREKGPPADDGFATADLFFNNRDTTFTRDTLPEWYALRADYTHLIPGDYNGDKRVDFIRQEKNGWDTDDVRTAEWLKSRY